MDTLFSEDRGLVYIFSVQLNEKHVLDAFNIDTHFCDDG